MDDVKSIFVPGSLLRDEMIMNGGAAEAEAPDEFLHLGAGDEEVADGDFEPDADDDDLDIPGFDEPGDFGEPAADEPVPASEPVPAGEPATEPAIADEPTIASEPIIASEPVPAGEPAPASDPPAASEPVAVDVDEPVEHPGAKTVLDTPLPSLDELDPVPMEGAGFFGTGSKVDALPLVGDDALFNMLQSFFVSSSMNNSVADILEEIAYDIHKIKSSSVAIAKAIDIATAAIVKMSERSSSRNA